MKTKKSTKRMIAVGIAVSGCLPVAAWPYEFGYPGSSLPAGVDILNVAASPPPGVYSFSEVYTAQTHETGPGAPNVGGVPADVHVAGFATGLLYSASWTVLGARYAARVVQPFSMVDASAPMNVQRAGVRNTYISPAELSWQLGKTGLFAKATIGVTVPDGTITGPAGMSSIGTPWWIIQPGFAISYLKNGWNLTATTMAELNTPNWTTNYRTGDILHANFVATKTLGKWTFGPIATYVGQVSDDSSSSFYKYAVNVNRYNIFSVGALVGYDFGPAAVNTWFTKDIVANASGGTPRGGMDTASITKGYKVFVGLSFPL
ncbi:SphA family protein [Burkholderia cenocepacia]|uniref:SphA family protein n=1 Tax=Burkholderia cenocepacia TaxID=95486 RepID=UPI00285857D0|nr:transporter [Burkholderia cenocepacia]MDR5645486.1 transporter [Burkholderia cenocepacia]